MQEQISEIFIYIKGTFKRKWLAICLAWLICLAGWALIMMLPDKYKSVAKVHVDSSTLLDPLLEDIAIQHDGEALVRVMKELMFTTPNLDKIIALSGLGASVENGLQRVQLYKDMRAGIFISGGSRDGLFEITYQSESPNMAKSVVSAVLTVFSEQTQQSTLDDANNSQNFIEKQIREYEIRLRDAEKVRESFKRKNFSLLDNFGLLPEKGQVDKLHVATEDLENARLLLREAISKRNVLAIQMREVSQSGDTWSASSDIRKKTPEEERISALQRRKTDLRLKYTDNHPAISAVEITLAEAIRSKEEKGRANASAGIPNAGVMSNPFVQQLVISLNGAEADVASNRARVVFLENRIKKYKVQLDARLGVETDMQNLNRDYETVQKNYEQLVQRREQARMSEKVDSETVSIKFRVADPPNKPLLPSGPKRLLLLSIVFLLSLIVGFGVVFLLYYVQPTFLTTRQLREVTGLPILGNVSLQTSGRKIKKNDFMFNFVFVVLICAYVGLMGFEYMRLQSM